MGNSQGILIPKPLLAQVGLEGEAEMTVEDGAIVLRKPRQPATRTGWGQAAQAIAEAGDDALVMPDFGNQGDTEFQW